MDSYKSFLEDVLRGASRIAVDNFGKVDGVVKAEDNNQVLTQTDLAIGKFIVDRIQEVYPTHNIIDEEAGIIDHGSRFTWVVDPIDGTSNFATGLPHFGIMAGLLEDDKPIAGGIALPAFEETYLAVRGLGATCNGERIEVSQQSRLLDALVGYGIDGHQEDPAITKNEVRLLAEIILSIRNLRSSNSAYDLAMVANGKYGATLNRTSKIWDNVAPQVLIEEAGGVYTDFFGQPIDYSSPLSKADTNFTVCAAAPALHRQLQQIINAI